MSTRIAQLSWLRLAGLRLLVAVAALASLVAGVMSQPNQASAIAQPSDPPVRTMEVENIAHFQGCTWWGSCSVKLNKAETIAVATGGSVYIGMLNVHVGAAYAGLAAYAIERGACMQINWMVWAPLRLSGSMVRC